MKLSSAIQESIVSLLLTDKEAGAVLRGMIPPKSFDPYFKEIATDAIAYWEDYSEPPGEHALDLFDGLRARLADRAPAYDRIWDSIQNTKVNRKYVLKQATTFLRYQRLRQGIAEAIESLDRDDEAGVLEAESALSLATKEQIDLFDPGINLRDDDRSMAFLAEDMEPFPTGIPVLDRYGLGPCREELHLLIAPYGTGKSWWLVWLLKIAVQHGFRVLYVTLEMSEDKVSERVHRTVFALGRRSSKASYLVWKKSDEGKVLGYDQKFVKGRPYTKQPGVRRIIKSKRRLFQTKPQVVIKGFPTSTLTIREFRAYLDGMENRGFIPDLVLVDYADLFNLGTGDPRMALGQVYKDLRGIAQERSFGMATASQMNRAGSSKRVGTGRDVAEDWSKMGTVDTAFTLNQTPAEKALGMARMFVDKGRADRDKFMVHLCQNLDLGQFHVDSAEMVARYWDLVGDEEDEENGDDE